MAHIERKQEWNSRQVLEANYKKPYAISENSYNSSPDFIRPFLPLQAQEIEL